MNSSDPDTPTHFLLVVDGLAAKHLSVYGNHWIDTPMIDRLANRSEIFEHCFVSESDLSLNCLNQIEPPSNSVLISDVVDRYSEAQRSRFAKIFQLHRPEVNVLAESMEQTTLAQLFAQTLEILPEVVEESPHLITIHLSGFYSAWDAPWELRQSFVEDEDPDAEHFFESPRFDWRAEDDLDPDRTLVLQQAFLAQLRLFDTCLGVLLDAIQLEHQSNIRFALTSTMGYPLGEHLLVGKSPECLYGEAIHIPWLVYDSTLEPTTYRHQPLHDGQDLIRLYSGEYDNLLGQQAVSSRLMMTTGPDDSFALRTPAWHFVARGERVELYAKPDDRWEINEISSRCNDVVELFQEIHKQISAGQTASSMELPERLTSTTAR